MGKVVIIGAGLGGLATALRLRQQGFQVTVLEKNSRPGGRSNLIEEDGFRVDTGPTILVMKSVFDELYETLGQDIDLRLNFVRLDPNYRVYYHDGSTLDLHSDLSELANEIEEFQSGGTERFNRFMDEGEKKYRLGMDFVTRNYQHITDLANPQAGLRLLHTRSYQNLYQQVASFFNHDDRLTKAFSFHSMFLGLSPFDALAMYSLITYADLALGMWYPMGGIYALVEDLLGLAHEMGVSMRTNSPVQEICIAEGRVSGVMLNSGEYIPADLVVSNADLPYTYRALIAPQYRKTYTDRRLDRMNYACSGYLLYLGVDKTYPHLQHQGLFFSQDYRANLDDIFKTGNLPKDPSFHLNIPTVTDTSLAPAGHSLLYLLAPMPNLNAGIDWNKAAPIVRARLIDRLEEIVDPQIRNHIVWEREYLPTDFQQDYNAVFGTAFGSLSHEFFQSSYFRPHNKDRDIQGLYFVGQGTYPGIGMPMVLISSRLVTERILAEWK